MAPIISTENQTVLLPVEIWLGGMKLRIKASNDPQKPRPPTNHIKPLPRLTDTERTVEFLHLITQCDSSGEHQQVHNQIKNNCQL